MASEGAGRLVGEQHPRLVRQRAGDGDALLLPAGKLGGVHVRLVAQIDQIQQFKHARFHIGLLHAGVAQRIGDVFKHSRAIQQVEMLEDHADAPPHRAELSFGQLPALRVVGLAAPERNHAGIADAQRAVVRRFQQVQAAHQRRFARAGHADNAENVALLDVQVDVFQGVYRLGFPLEGLCQVVQLNERQDGSTPFNMHVESSHVLVTKCIIYEMRHIGKHRYYMIGHRIKL